MNKYQELELKVDEMQQEIERLKKEEKENSLPKDFNRQYAINLLKAVDELNYDDYEIYLDSAFIWDHTPQGWDYWNDLIIDVCLFTDKDYIQIQKWIIMSFQQEQTK